MAKNIIAQALGGEKKVIDNVETIGEVADKLGTREGYTAALNGEAAKMDDYLEDGDVVTFSKAVKGGC